MNNIYSDWINFCEGRQEFDKSHFLSLFKAGLSDEELKKALQYFPSGGDIYSRLKEVLDSGYLCEYAYLMPAKKHQLDEKTLLMIAKEWLDERALFCKNSKEMELFKIAVNAQISFSSRKNVRKKMEDNDIPNARLYDLMCDTVIDSTLIETKQADALFEAAYELAADYPLSWFICQTLIDIDIDFRKYFEFWKGGGFDVLR